MEAREEELERELSSCNVEALTMERFTAHISSVFHSFSSFSFLLSIPFLILFLILPILEFLAKEKESWEKRKEEEEQPWEDETDVGLLRLRLPPLGTAITFPIFISYTVERFFSFLLIVPMWRRRDKEPSGRKASLDCFLPLEVMGRRTLESHFLSIVFP